MKNLRKISRESLKSITGGINSQSPGDWMCGPGRKYAKCTDPDTGATYWQCTLNGDPRMCMRIIPV
ncbi:bacteriocin-like protein [Chryseobacterium gambrini]|uniref:Uncharacterized protein n=1 Tax=Chryseobacterium gambrini TaxID=373672 RepID=A0A1N7QA42_9FLAO|nr:hypothetical protein [Chryseobacterium gambrini]MBL7879864.1 hypothetical protein [Chryseobacterium gambrini]SIT19706.1 hypothetical protein SAMN05421785_11017 [Chryseobacterium gambrini]